MSAEPLFDWYGACALMQWFGGSATVFIQSIIGFNRNALWNRNRIYEYFLQDQRLFQRLSPCRLGTCFFPRLKDSQKQNYMNKSEAFLWAARADILLSMCKKEEAINSLRMAKEVALRFDKSPNVYGGVSGMNKKTVYDFSITRYFLSICSPIKGATW